MTRWTRKEHTEELRYLYMESGHFGISNELDDSEAQIKPEDFRYLWEQVIVQYHKEYNWSYK